jgi:hypothetical protein
MSFVKLHIGLILSLLLQAAASAQLASSPYVHYDAADPNSVIFTEWADPNVPEGNHLFTPYISQWDDLSGNANDAIHNDRAFHNDSYISAEFSTGLPSVDVGFWGGPDPNNQGGNGSDFSILPAGGQDDLLNFATNGKSGFTFFTTIHNDGQTTNAAGNFSPILSNGPFPNNTGGVGIWINQAGFIWGQLGNGLVLSSFSGYIAPGQEGLVAFTYDASTGANLLENINGDDPNGSGTVSDPNNMYPNLILRSIQHDLSLGVSPQHINFFFNGDFGEVLLYDRFIDPNSSEYANTLSFLEDKWLNGPEGVEGDFNGDGFVGALIS